MTPKTKKIEIAIFAAVAIMLVAIWAINGFENTWLYVLALIITIPISWFRFHRPDKNADSDHQDAA